MNAERRVDREREGGSRHFWRKDIDAPVFYPAAALIIGFVALTIPFQKVVGDLFQRTFRWVATYTGWFLILTVNVVLLFVVYLALSRFAHVRIGGPTARAEFRTSSWLAMLYSAGLGIGLLFFGVAEPVLHFVKSPFAAPRSADAAQMAMSITFLHWGFHGWAVYALVGLSLAFACFNRGLPLTLRSAFHPLLGDRIRGPVGHFIDVSATVATLFGVAVSLALGAQQVNAGLHHVFDVPDSALIQLAIIAFITLLATASVVSGLFRGIRRASEINVTLAGILFVFVFSFGPTLFLLDGFVQNVGHYLKNFVWLSTWTEAYRSTNWQDAWTIFYWAWWIAWGPFVGMFIARISKGRTIREFVVGVLGVPVLVSFLWMTVFGSTALHMELYGSVGIADAVDQNLATALFVFLQRFPIPMVTCSLAVVVVIIFFVTSSDSGSMVIDIITSGGNIDPPIPQRIFWAVLEGVVAAALLFGGGLIALQTATLAASLPFAVITLLMIGSLYKSLSAYKIETGAG